MRLDVGVWMMRFVGVKKGIMRSCCYFFRLGGYSVVLWVIGRGGFDGI